jgi:hypothetical protein
LAPRVRLADKLMPQWKIRLKVLTFVNTKAGFANNSRRLDRENKAPLVNSTNVDCEEAFHTLVFDNEMFELLSATIQGIGIAK